MPLSDRITNLGIKFLSFGKKPTYYLVFRFVGSICNYKYSFWTLHNSFFNKLYIQGSKEVFYAGDVHSAKEEVSGLIRTLGFSPIDRGALRNAREIEDIPVQRFPLWKTPLIISTVLFTVLFLLSFSK